MKVHVRVTSGRKRTGGQKTLDLSRGYPVSKGKPIFQPTSVKFGSGRRGIPSIRIKVIPSNYEWKVRFQQRLQNNDPEAWTALQRLKLEYEKIVERGHGTLVIPKGVPMTLGQSTWLTIGGKFVVFALRSQKVRSYPGYYHMVGGIPFSAKPRRATNKLLRQNVQEELVDELGVPKGKISLGKPMGVHLTLERDGLGLNVVQPARLDVNASSFIQKHFRLADLKDPAKGFVLQHEVKEGWEAAHFVLIPNTHAALQEFRDRNNERLTPPLAYALQQLLSMS